MPSTDESSSTTLFDGFTVEAVIECCSDVGVFKRGQELFSAGKVNVIDRGKFTWSAEVEGSGKKPYSVAVDRLLGGRCPCKAWINSARAVLQTYRRIGSCLACRGWTTTF